MSILATFVLVTNDSKEIVRVLCIKYSIQFQEDLKKVRALLNSGNKVNILNPAFTQKLGLYIRKTIIRARKIDGSTLETFAIVIADL